jgi:hypothetical protein
LFAALLAFAALFVSAELQSAPGVAAASRVAATSRVWHGTAEGVRLDIGTSTSGTVSSTSVSLYQVALSFSFRIGPGGRIEGSGSGHYDDADWHLSGVNGSDGPFACNPAVGAHPFSVGLGGHFAGTGGTLTLATPGATETNRNWNCGAHFTGYATTTHTIADALSRVLSGGLHISSRHPVSATHTKHVDLGKPGNGDDDTIVWTFSVGPPAKKSKHRSCGLALTKVLAKPAPTLINTPIVVGFHISAAAHAKLLVTPAGGKPSTVASMSLQKGSNALVWGGFLHSLPAPAGTYALTVQAQRCGKTQSTATSDSTT